MASRTPLILSGEDEAAIAALLHEAFGLEPSYQTLVVGAAASALAALQQVQLLLLDVNLPGLDGLQVYDLLQQNPRTRPIPGLFMTAHPGNPRLQVRLDARVLAKPFDLATLFARMAPAVPP